MFRVNNIWSSGFCGSFQAVADMLDGVFVGAHS